MIKNLGRSVRKAFALVATITSFIAFSATPAAAAVLLVNGNGQLTGATGVDVNGTLFDVSFIGGECADAFGVCDESAFAFNTEMDALAAGQALLDQVFLDGPEGDFDTVPSAIQGCFLSSGNCFARIPFSIDNGVFQVTVNNLITVDSDFVFAEGPFDLDNGPFSNVTFGVFTASEVPLPAAAWMFLAGLGGLSAARRKRRVIA